MTNNIRATVETPNTVPNYVPPAFKATAEADKAPAKATGLRPVVILK